MKRATKHNGSVLSRYERISRNLGLKSLDDYLKTEKTIALTTDKANEKAELTSVLSLAVLLRREIERQKASDDLVQLQRVTEYAASSFLKLSKEISTDPQFFLNKFLATAGKRQGFSNLVSYTRYLLSRTRLVSYKQYLRTKVAEKGFSPYSVYLEDWAKRKGFSSNKEYQYRVLKSKGFNSPTDYKNYLAEKKGLNSAYEYNEHLARKRQQKPEYRQLGEWIRMRLRERGWTRSDLAKKTGLSRQMVSLYAQGKTRPKPRRLSKIRKILGG